MKTPEQEAFIQEVAEGTSSIDLRAVAGSGKTTTLKWALENLDKIGHKPPTLAVAFNKATAMDLAAALPSWVECRTMNALGHKVWTNKYGRPNLDGRKVNSITTELTDECKDLWPSVRDGITELRQKGWVDESWSIQGHSFESITTASPEDILKDSDIPELDDDVIHLSIKGVAISIALALQENKIDFDDQLYMPLILKLPFTKYALVFVDEAQDLSPIQHEMLARSLSKGNPDFNRPAGRLIAVGDPNQAIYGFRGALSKSMSDLQERFSSHKMELTVNFRCGQEIVAEAQKHVPAITAHEGAWEGSVTHMGEWHLDEINYGAVVCRTNAPLFRLALELIKNQRGFTLVGGAMERQLKALAKRIAGRRKMSAEDFVAELRKYVQSEINRLTEKRRTHLIAPMEDRAAILVLLADHIHPKEHYDKVFNVLAEIMSKGSEDLILTSIHKAKGLEWDRVFFLNYNQVPPGWLVHKVRKGTLPPSALDQEYNLAYVAITRAAKELFYLTEDEALF